MKKKILISIVALIVLIGSPYAYIQYKLRSVQKNVTEYLTTDGNISKNDIVYNKRVFANLKGNKNWMVAIKLKNDNKTYYYYIDNKNIILESYSENGKEHVLNKIINK
ncbi:hypothetical protein ACE38V_15705 [Cytobacillus sp. Hz8]|uniref:hypothetical protein n=1 Tax=Cytobacillus sp. Hz8 TaxID=3347168 RepID=UPI0035DB7C3D